MVKKEKEKKPRQPKKHIIFKYLGSGFSVGSVTVTAAVTATVVSATAVIAAAGSAPALELGARWIYPPPDGCSAVFWSQQTGRTDAGPSATVERRRL